MLKALEAKTIIDVARVNKDRRRDGDNDSKQEYNGQVIHQTTKPVCNLETARQTISNVYSPVLPSEWLIKENAI